ncbi:hypothetical protein WA026_007594 [Henosepilachna vigintioctopunctata]|uniref:Sm domain-containing protein n=1 Tax=Henosepilachna vigintioctopunctata TaxID=420089 RepID=A0AAW1UUJ3_9CUCU
MKALRIVCSRYTWSSFANELVWTRNAHTVRGYCIAYVNAFDKHWNLALSEITEVWTRPAKRKTVALESDRDSSYRLFRKVIPPPITILKATKKEELCSRKVDQYVLRGEHVVLIQVYDGGKGKK